jgi:outer membrane protein OmpA-like peptidoglycan-associated protein
MKKLLLSLLIPYSFVSCAQSNYDSNAFFYDNVIDDEQVVQNTLVRHQRTVNYYHVNETKENHYYIGNTKRYYPYQRSYYYGYRRYQAPYRQPNRYYRSGHKYRYAEPITNSISSNKWFFYFELDSDSIINEEEIMHLIDFAKVNRNVVFYIDSYADAQTGNSEYNMDLSIRRANAITSILQREGISRNRLMVCPNGSNVQKYNTNNLNRCVTVKAQIK